MNEREKKRENEKQARWVLGWVALFFLHSQRDTYTQTEDRTKRCHVRE